MNVFIQFQFTNMTDQRWDECPVHVYNFKDRQAAASWARVTADILDYNIRLTYPPEDVDVSTWSKHTIQENGSKLSGSYFSKSVL